jgi:hypothetical protein
MNNTRSISFKNLPFLHFFANIVDPDEKHDNDIVCKAIIEKFDLNTENTNFHTINGLLSKHVSVEKVRTIIFELPFIGFIKVYKEYKKLTYKDHAGECDVYSIIEVNSKEIEVIKGYNEEKILQFKDYIETLYSSESNKNLSWSDVFELCWSMFPKGNKIEAMKEFSNACECFTRKDDTELEAYEKYSIYAKWIKSKWDAYLWEKHETEQKHEYCLGLKEFITRNLNSWLEKEENQIVRINVYTDEHEFAVISFINMQEPSVKYAIKSIWD